MKKILSAIILISVTVMMILQPAEASVQKKKKVNYIIDKSNFLTSEQKKILQTRCEWLTQEGLTLYIYTDNEPFESTDAIMEKINAKITSDYGLLFYADSSLQNVILQNYSSEYAPLDSEHCNSIAELTKSRMNSMDFYEGCQILIKNIENMLVGETKLYTNLTYMPAIVDEAEYLTDSEEAELTQSFEFFRNNYAVDVALITELGQSGSSPYQAANDIYDYNFYGMGLNDDGILFYLCEETGEHYFVTRAYGKKYFNSGAINYIEECIKPHLENGDYYLACKTYSDAAYEILENVKNGKTYSSGIEKIILAFGIIILAVILYFFLKKKKNNTTVKTQGLNI